VCGVIAMFSINIYMYIVLRMLIGFCFVGCAVCTHVLSKCILSLAVRCVLPLVYRILFIVDLLSLKLVLEQGIITLTSGS